MAGGISVVGTVVAEGMYAVGTVVAGGMSVVGTVVAEGMSVVGTEVAGGTFVVGTVSAGGMAVVETVVAGGMSVLYISVLINTLRVWWVNALPVYSLHLCPTWTCCPDLWTDSLQTDKHLYWTLQDFLLPLFPAH